jgi:hypothetical protein
MHPRFEDWIELIEGSVAGAARHRLEEHLAECDECCKREREIRDMLETMVADRLLEPSPAALSSVFEALRPSGFKLTLPGWARGLRERLARPAFDTLENRQEAFAGARSSSVARRLRFNEGRLELDILVEAEGDRRRLTAQLLSLGEEPQPLVGARFLVSASGTIEADGETDAHGGFLREVAAPGDIEVRVATEDGLVVFTIPDC